MPSLADINAQWGDTFDQIGQQYGLDPDLLRAIALQENVNPSYNNPLGRSSDAGVYHYTPEQGQAAIAHQAALLTNPNGPYKDFVQTGNIHDLAKVYSPVGAKNDVYGTNADEPYGIISALDMIKGQTTSGSVRPPLAAAQNSPIQTSGAFQPASPAAAMPAAAATGIDPALQQRINELQTAMALYQRSAMAPALAQATTPATGAPAAAPGYAGLNLGAMGGMGGGNIMALANAIRQQRAMQALRIQNAANFGGQLAQGGLQAYGNFLQQNPGGMIDPFSTGGSLAFG